MNDRDALYAAILAHPDEDTPRLAFADWLEENGGDDRAAFIRRQIEVAKVPEWDPVAIRARRPDYEVSYGAKWPEPALPEPLMWEGSPCRRGFPAAVQIHDGRPFVEHLPAALALAPLCELVWWGNRKGRVGGCGPLPHWTSLTNSPWLSRFHAMQLPLSILTPSGLSALDGSPHTPNLIRLDLKTCDFDHDLTIAFLETKLFRRLTHLALTIRDGGTGDVAAAAALARGHRLESVSLCAGSNLTHSRLLWDTDFLRSPLFRGLKELDLSNNLMGPPELDRFVSSGAIRGLESLKLNWCRFGPDEAASALVGSADLSGLRRLGLDQNDLDHQVARTIAESPHLRYLTVLSLERNPIGNAGAVALANSPHLANLLELNLNQCGIGDEGAEALLGSPLCGTLERLSLFSVGKEIKPATKRKLRKRMGDRVIY